MVAALTQSNNSYLQKHNPQRHGLTFEQRPLNKTSTVPFFDRSTEDISKQPRILSGKIKTITQPLLKKKKLSSMTDFSKVQQNRLIDLASQLVKLGSSKRHTHRQHSANIIVAHNSPESVTIQDSSKEAQLPPLSKPLIQQNIKLPKIPESTKNRSIKTIQIYGKSKRPSSFLVKA